jgi:transposase
MPKKLHHVKLTPEEREELEALTHKGEVQVRVYKRAHMLLLADEGFKDAEIMTRTGSSRATVGRIRARYGREGAWAAIAEKPRSGRPSIFDGEVRAKITALACSSPPEGRARWDLRLLADKAVELCYVEDISHESVRSMLKKTNSSRTSRGNGA